MSAFMVGKDHIDGLLTAGLEWSRPSRLKWFYPEIGPDDERDAYARGVPWGPRCIELCEERRRELTLESVGRVGAMLLAENRASVNHRYDEEEWEEPYLFEPLPGISDPVIVLKAIACYRYQSCEHPEWERSEARVFIDALEQKAIVHLPGYDDAPGWEIRDRDVFVRARAHQPRS